MRAHRGCKHPILVVPVLVIVALALGPADAARAAVCGVPSPYPTIQSAVNDASCAVIQLAAATPFNENVTISGSVYLNGAIGATVNGGGAGSVFTINSNASVTLALVTISGGMNADGGGIYNLGALTLSHVTVSGNTASASGGGIYSLGTLTMSSSTVSGNSAGTMGGGIYNEGILTLNGSTLSGNSAATYGGGIANNGGSVTLNRSTLNGNSAATYGGGIASNNGSVTLNRSTLSGNSAGTNGGGIYNNTPGSSLLDSTIAFNLANAHGQHSTASGGGLFNESGAAVSLENTILDSNAVDACSLFCIPIPDDCAGSLTSQDYNLISAISNDCMFSGATGHNITNQNGLLGPLADNGGETQTHALLRGSPAIDAIFYGQNGCGSNPTADQRGWLRPYPPGTNCDIGAYERGAFLWLPLVVR